MVNNKYNRWTVLEIGIFKTERRTRKTERWLCQCDCGTIRELNAAYVMRGDSQSCGCFAAELASRHILDLKGRRFGKLIVIEESHRGRGVHWKILCDCGVLKTAASGDLVAGRCRSCGCGRNNTDRIQSIDEDTTQGFKRLVRRYVDSAKRRKIEFLLSLDEIRYLTKQKCSYCGIEPCQNIGRVKNIVYKHNGIDRVDSSKPYIIENCVTCCKMCNFAKMDNSYNDFVNWIKRAYHYLNRIDTNA